jgi:hypothetical protein
MVFDPKPAIIGHRGFGAGERNGYRANTLESYLAAVAHGLTWIELDVQRSRDGQLVPCHDTVTEKDEFIVSLDASELTASGIPLFEDAIAALPPGVAVNIDVKTIVEDAVDPLDRRTATLAAAGLRAHAGRRPLFVSLSDPSLLVYQRETGRFPGPGPAGPDHLAGLPPLARHPGRGQPRTGRGLPEHQDARDALGPAAPDGPHHQEGDQCRVPGRPGSDRLAGKPGQRGRAGSGRYRRPFGERRPRRARRPSR